MPTGEPARLYGSLTRGRFRRGGFWNTITATTEELALGRWPLSRIILERRRTDAVVVDQVGPLRFQVRVTFRVDGRPLGCIFSSSRPQRLVDALRALEWPVVEVNRAGGED